jgi:hypothetical protein
LNVLFVAVFGFIAFLIIHWVLSSFQRRGAIEGFTYKPSSAAPNTKVSFSYLDLISDASSICEFIKIDNTLVKSDPSNTSIVKSDYTVPSANLQIYKLYNALLGNGASQALTDAMDASYGKLFDSKRLNSMRPQDISAEWVDMNATQTDDALYNTVKLFVIQSEVVDGGKCASVNDVDGMSAYFLKSITENKSNEGALQALKHAYYAIVKPRFLANRLSNMYWDNVQSFKSADKDSNNSLIYVVNTFSELMQTPTLETDLSANGAANVIGPDTPFPSKDPIQIYQTASVVYELGRFVNKSRQSDGKIKTDLVTFNAGYPKYLKSATGDSQTSPFLFLLQNPPDSNDCPSAAYLEPGFSNIQY